VVCGGRPQSPGVFGPEEEIPEQMSPQNYKKIIQTVSSDTESTGSFVYPKCRQKQYTEKVAEKGGAE
jgi:hypothetical protein